ncbi:elongation of very long chain fatty acids protein AAEL008004-like [Eriocheir sinensis]|uniref:elongation of very long chain fatty acids protein AAEL008004-like n=1 Tax=Eriocheir sinensis TaxID=95602 RepID=UPI0021C9D70D|nr:elongation of very long chain fatty acids protein AAEL008004-like [Eriocheir sinensis]
MAPNETAENMTHLRRTYDPKSLEHDTPSHQLADAEVRLQPIDRQQLDPRGRSHDHTIETKTHHSKDTGDPTQPTSVERKLLSSGIKAAAITLFLYFYGNHMVSSQMKKDPRVDSWMYGLYSSPTPTLLACLAYIAGITYIGPRLMRGRQPPKWLKTVMVMYNALQVAYCSWMFYEAGMAGWFGSYSFICQPCDFSNSPSALRMLRVAIAYHLSKFLDFFDTIFFVLNHKYSHVSLLHVTHHALMPMGLWYGIRHEPGGQTTFFGFLNGFIHIVMYLYYLLAALGPRVRPYLWWKRYLTTLQMVQFVAMFVHALQSLILGCPAGLPLMKIIMVMAAIFQVLFTDFYIKAYRKKATQTSPKPIKLPMMCSSINQQEDVTGSEAPSEGENQNLRNRVPNKAS